MKIFSVPDFFQNGIFNLLLNFNHVYQRMNKISEMNVYFIKANLGIQNIAAKTYIDCPASIGRVITATAICDPD